MDTVDGAVAVITGAGSGIGRATAHALAQRGGVVLVSDLDVGRAETVATEITAGGGRAVGARCDVTSDDPPTPVQMPQLPLISAEEAGELVVRGILDDVLLVLTVPGAQTMVERHVTDREGFLASQIAYLGGAT